MIRMQRPMPAGRLLLLAILLTVLALLPRLARAEDKPATRTIGGREHQIQTVDLLNGTHFETDPTTGASAVVDGPLPAKRYDVAWNIGYSHKRHRWSTELAVTYEWRTFHDVLGIRGFDIEGRALGAIDPDSEFPSAGVWLLGRIPVAREVDLIAGPAVRVDGDGVLRVGVVAGFSLYSW